MIISAAVGAVSLHHLAEEVVDLMKDQCGKEVFSVAHTAVHQQAVAVRTKRRTEKALQVYTTVKINLNYHSKIDAFIQEVPERKITDPRPKSGWVGREVFYTKSHFA